MIWIGPIGGREQLQLQGHRPSAIVGWYARCRTGAAPGRRARACRRSSRSPPGGLRRPPDASGRAGRRRRPPATATANGARRPGSALEVGGSGRPGEVRRQPLVERGDERVVAPVRPRVAERARAGTGRARAARTMPASSRARRGASCRHPVDEGRRGLARRGPAGGTCSSRRMLPRRCSIRSTRSPRSRSHTSARRSSTWSPSVAIDVVGADRRGESDAGVLAVAVDVGGDDERLVGERVLAVGEGAGAGAQLELPGRRAARGEPIGVGEQQEAAGPFGVERARGRARVPHASGEVAGTDADALDRPPVGAVVEVVVRRPAARADAMSVGNSSGRPRRMSRSSTSAPSTQASERSRSAAATTMCARRGCSGSGSIRRPAAVSWPVDVERAEHREQLAALRRAPAPVVGRTTPARPAGVPHAASSRASPARSTWVISASRWARRVACSSLLHSR